jgi:single-strand DNA-binding protein
MFKAVVIGNLGNDPDLRYSASGAPLLRFNLAANYRTKNDQNEWTEKTEWVRCTVFGNRAESLGNLLKKGTKVYVEGRLEARPWTAQDGSIRAGLEIAANEVELMSPRQEGEYSHPTNTVNAQRQAVPAGANDDIDADIPF